MSSMEPEKIVPLDDPFICHKCKFPLKREKNILHNGSLYHMNCFMCHYCLKKLVGEKYFAIEDTFFCAEHYEQRKNRIGYLKCVVNNYLTDNLARNSTLLWKQTLSVTR